MWILEILFTIIFEYLILGLIGGLLGYTGAFIMNLFSGFKHPINHYLNNEKYNIQPYIVGFITITIISCLIGKLI